MAKLNQAMNDLLRYDAAILPRKRSIFDKSHSHTTTLDSGYLVPIMWDRVLPGDEKQIRYSGLARMATPLHPVMDEAYLDTWCFYIPDRLWWSNAKKFYGENLEASFNPDGRYVMPHLKPSQYGVRDNVNNLVNGINSLNDYFGFPVVYDDDNFLTFEFDSNIETHACAGLHRSYQLIWNEFFRNSSIQPALQLNFGDDVTDYEWQTIREIRRVNKLPDMFTTLLRDPQAGYDVLMPLGEWAPVVTRDPNHGGLTFTSDGSGLFFKEIAPNGDVMPIEMKHNLMFDSQGFVGYDDNNTSADNMNTPVTPANLWASLSQATSASINNIRAAVTVQQLLEIDASAGKRYQQLIYSHFGVLTPDATLQRPELLGLSRTTVGMRQTIQVSASTDSSPLGNTAAVSVTNVANEWICNKAFTEPGFIMVLCAVRPLHSYSQGLNPLLRKLNRYDHYYPVFDNLGNQPVYKSEIYSGIDTNNGRVGPSGTTRYDLNFTEVFGYKPAWQEYRMMSNRVSSLMRPDLANTLASWNYSTKFDSTPTLGNLFIREDPELIDRTIAVKTEPQFILDNYFDYKDTKNMSVYSVPGLTRF